MATPPPSPSRLTHFGTAIGSIARNLFGPRGLLGIIAVSAFTVTGVATWWYNNSSFGHFSQVLGFPIASAGLGIWIADFYYRKDAYEKRFRDVSVSTYTIGLLIDGVETILRHVNAAKDKADDLVAQSDEYKVNLTATADLASAATAARQTIRVASMAFVNLELFSAEAVQRGKEKFSLDDKDFGIRQQLVQGKPNETLPQQAEDGEPTDSNASTNTRSGGKTT
ncbi:hypothetical protein [Mycobacterium sp. 1245805.9]|uniref:hypothetical protein n=1 Tax=Mycobacterium sp. 1245805.9 TaxID=1856862 RepID=UPI0012EAA2F6|nr:hypothetical protein [Mycobacterium sp. 1245805.9]